MTENERNLYTAGYLSQRFQKSPREIESILDEAGYRPVLCINDLPHWSMDAVVHLRTVARSKAGEA